MIAAIYARKSTEQSAVEDEEKSVTRHIEHAEAYAARKAWTIAVEHIYVEHAIPAFAGATMDEPREACQVGARKDLWLFSQNVHAGKGSCAQQ